MNKCVRVIFNRTSKDSSMVFDVQKEAHKFFVEGFIQVSNDEIKIIACGNKENIDQFVDILHKICINNPDQLLDVEPFLKDKEYRGVFRIIE